MSLCSLGNMRWVRPRQFASSIHLNLCINSPSWGVELFSMVLFWFVCVGVYVFMSFSEILVFGMCDCIGLFVGVS